MSSSMTPSDREALSALFDGELDGDAMRFALRRLDHDAEWRDACSRWQLAGDVLRGQAAGLAPAGFAQRVSAALAAEATPVAVVAGDERRASSSAAQAQARRWWGRAALAASVAVAALFVTHPFSGVGTGSDAEAVDNPVAVIPAATGPSAGNAPALAPDAAPAAPAGGVEVAVAAVAVADAPRRVAERRSRSGAPSAVASTRRSMDAPATMALAAESSPRPAAPAVTDPFKPQAGDLVSRPWPRAVLPGSSATGAFTASYGTTQASPSFYPFEPDAAHAPASAADATPQP